MRAYRLQAAGIDGLAEVELPMPKPGPRQVLVKVAACSLNFRDLAIALGTYRMPTKPNLVPLSDGAGEVVEVGPGVTRVKAGDRVAGCFFQRWFGGPPAADTHVSALGGGLDGMLAEYVVLEEDGVVTLPAHLSRSRKPRRCPARRSPPGTRSPSTRASSPGQTVLVQGTGGVSIFALQFARLMGARVIVTSSSDEKLARAKALGAAHGVNYKATPEWDKAVVELTGGGVDHVVEVGGPGTLARSLRAIRVGGKITLIGVLSGAAEINPMLIFSRRANVQGISVGSTQMFEAMNRAIAASGLKPIIDKVFAFDEAPAAYRHLQSAQHFGKVVIRVG